MSKIGMRPIETGSVKVSVKNSTDLKLEKNGLVSEHVLPSVLEAVVEDSKLFIKLQENQERNKENKEAWGLHRALVSNKIKGIDTGFSSVIRMVGLAYKAVLQQDKLILSVGFSHKIEIPLEKDIAIEIDKTGQVISLKSNDKFRLGNFCSKIRSLKGRDPYKGTGIFVNNEVLIRKAGKSKS